MSQKHCKSVKKSCRESRGFTLIELLVVVAIIAILAALLLPALSRSKQQAQGSLCLSNRKELQVGWGMYCGDNKDRVPPVDDNWNTPNTAAQWVAYWCDGTMSDYANCVNEVTIKDGLLYPLLGNLKVYKCPGDMSTQKNAVNALRGRSSGCSPAPQHVVLSGVFGRHNVARCGGRSIPDFQQNGRRQKARRHLGLH